MRPLTLYKAALICLLVFTAAVAGCWGYLSICLGIDTGFALYLVFNVVTGATPIAISSALPAIAPNIDAAPLGLPLMLLRVVSWLFLPSALFAALAGFFNRQRRIRDIAFTTATCEFIDIVRNVDPDANVEEIRRALEKLRPEEVD